MRDRLGTFCVDDDLNVGAVHGEIAHRLGCDSLELTQQGWRPYLLRDDLVEVERMAANLKRHRLDEYRMCGIAKNRERLYVRLQPYLLATVPKPMMGGGILLDMWESPRTYFFATAVGRRHRLCRTSRERSRFCVLFRSPRRRVRPDRRRPLDWMSTIVACQLAACLV